MLLNFVFNFLRLNFKVCLFIEPISLWDVEVGNAFILAYLENTAWLFGRFVHGIFNRVWSVGEILTIDAGVDGLLISVGVQGLVDVL